MSYIPIPPRVWSRVQSLCTYVIPGLPDQYKVYIPLTNQIVSQGQADYEMKQFYKGNILQYKGNSARFTKSQKYSQLARCTGPNRTKVFATQSEIYSNPNTTGLLRTGYTTYPYPNDIVGAPNNISGPFAYNIRNPNGCQSKSIQDGGVLVCGTLANPCTGEIYKRPPLIATICNPTSASNVPGPGVLCWNNKIQTYFPRQNFINNNNSTDKWPFNYKGFVSAIKPNPPELILLSTTDLTATLSWIYTNNQCVPITNINLFQNGNLILKVPYTITSVTVNLVCGNNDFFIEATSGNIQSEPSNTVSFLNSTKFISLTNGTSSYDDLTNTYTLTFTNISSIGSFNIICSPQSATYTIVGGGENGQDGYWDGPNVYGGDGGNGGEIKTGSFTAITGVYNVSVGNINSSSVLILPNSTNITALGGSSNLSASQGGSGGTGGDGASGTGNGTTLNYSGGGGGGGSNPSPFPYEGGLAGNGPTGGAGGQNGSGSGSIDGQDALLYGAGGGGGAAEQNGSGDEIFGFGGSGKQGIVIITLTY
jgi:hypothetical protein